MRYYLIAALALLAACTENGSLMFVTVDAATPLPTASRLHVGLTHDGTTRTRGLSLAPVGFPPSHSFAVQLNAGVVGALDVSVEAFDDGGKSLATTHGSIDIVAGGRADLPLTLGGGPSAGDMSGGTPDDLGPADMTYVPLTWTAQMPPAGGSYNVIWGTDATHVWIGADSTSSNSYSRGDDVWNQTSTVPFYSASGFWGTDPTHVFLVDHFGGIRAWDPTKTNWVDETHVYPVGSNKFGDYDLTGIWGTSLNDIYISARYSSTPGAFVFHNTSSNIATNWTLVMQDTGAGLNGISGTTGAIYTVGSKGRVLRSTDGTHFSPLASGTGEDLNAVFVLDSQHVYIAGTQGTLLFSPGDGTFVQQLVPGQFQYSTFYSVWAADPDNVFVVGNRPGDPSLQSGLLHGNALGTWVAQQSGLEDKTELKSVWGSSVRNVYVAGGSWVAHGK